MDSIHLYDILKRCHQKKIPLKLKKKKKPQSLEFFPFPVGDIADFYFEVVEFHVGTMPVSGEPVTRETGGLRLIKVPGTLGQRLCVCRPGMGPRKAPFPSPSMHAHSAPATQVTRMPGTHRLQTEVILDLLRTVPTYEFVFGVNVSAQ